MPIPTFLRALACTSLLLGLGGAQHTMPMPMPAPAPAPASTARPTAPARPAGPALHVDQTLRMSAPYTPDRHLPDDYRCFVLDPGLTEDRALTGYEVRPGQPNMVHHVIVHVATPDQLASVRARDGQDGQPGWSCFGGTGVKSNLTAADRAAVAQAAVTGRFDSDLLDRAGGMGGALGIGSWTPGSTATLFPDGTGRTLPKGSVLVMQVHYNTALAARPDVTAIDLQYAPPGAALRPLRNVNAFAPVELPCYSGQQDGPCSRDAALQYNKDRYGARSGLIPEALRRVCGQGATHTTPGTPPVTTSTCTLPVGRDGTAYGVILHMHTRGQSASLVLNPGTPREQTLLDIPAWDFHWQGSYWYETPIAVRRGDTLQITCRWATTPADTRYVVWGEGTQDEMCLGALTVTDR